MGRQSGYTEELGDLICERIVSGCSIRKICAESGMPAASSVFKWLSDHSRFSEQYARAKQAQAEALADEIISIADEREWHQSGAGTRDNVERSKLRVDARKWVAARLLPKKYGDRIEVEHGNNDSLAQRLKEARMNVARARREGLEAIAKIQGSYQ